MLSVHGTGAWWGAKIRWQGPLGGSDHLEEALSQKKAQKDKAPLKKTPDMSLDRHLVGEDGSCRTNKSYNRALWAQ